MTNDLFGYESMAGRNLLPMGGQVTYWSRLFSPSEADRLAVRLMQEVEWRNDQAVIFGKIIITRRQVAWYADQPYAYTYSGTTKTALPWLEPLNEIRQRVESICQTSFNACLLNLYPSGEDGMAWHSDAEKELRQNGVIASLSFGAERRFQFKHKKTKELVTLWLEHGSLLVMEGATQSHWLHRLPKAPQVKEHRINLTFRQMNSYRQPLILTHAIQ